MDKFYLCHLWRQRFCSVAPAFVARRAETDAAAANGVRPGKKCSRDETDPPRATDDALPQIPQWFVAQGQMQTIRKSGKNDHFVNFFISFERYIRPCPEKLSKVEHEA